MSCKYCDIDYDPIHEDRTKIPSPDPDLYLYTNDCGGVGTINIYYWNDCIDVEVEDIFINFCPMCGKEFKVEF